MEVAHPGLSIHLSASLTAGNFPGAPCSDSWDEQVPRWQPRPSLVHGEEEAAAHTTSHWLALGTEMMAGTAVGISQAGLQRHQAQPGASGKKGRKGPLFSQIIPHDAACSRCGRKC